MDNDTVWVYTDPNNRKWFAWELMASSPEELAKLSIQKYGRVCAGVVPTQVRLVPLASEAIHETARTAG